MSNPSDKDADMNPVAGRSPIHFASSLATRIGAVALVAALVAGCGETDTGTDTSPSQRTATAQTEQTEQTTATAQTGTAQSAASYFAAIASRDVAELESASSLAALGSPAAAYLTYTLEVARALGEEGKTAPPAAFTEAEDSYSMCDGVGEKRTCLEWTDIEMRGDKLVAFNLAGEPVSSRVTAGDPSRTSTSSAAEIEFVSAYSSPTSGALFVVSRVTARQSLDLKAGTRSAYVAADDTEFPVVDRLGVDAVEAGTTRIVVHVCGSSD